MKQQISSVRNSTTVPQWPAAQSWTKIKDFKTVLCLCPTNSGCHKASIQINKPNDTINQPSKTNQKYLVLLFKKNMFLISFVQLMNLNAVYSFCVHVAVRFCMAPCNVNFIMNPLPKYLKTIDSVTYFKSLLKISLKWSFINVRSKFY